MMEEGKYNMDKVMFDYANAEGFVQKDAIESMKEAALSAKQTLVGKKRSRQ